MVIVAFIFRILHWPGSSDNPLPDILRLDGVLPPSLRQRVRHHRQRPPAILPDDPVSGRSWRRVDLFKAVGLAVRIIATAAHVGLLQTLRAV